MTLVEKLRKQHEDLIALSKNLTDYLDEEISIDIARILREKFKTLSLLLEEHLILEDEFLYPALKNRPQAEIRDLAYRFATELGGLKDALVAYNQQYNTPEHIAESPTAFISETKAMITALRNRIKKEDNELFSLLE